jgi:trans-aconitate 2-methyltransferase
MKTSSEIKNYYDKFATEILARDFYYINPRHDAIKSLCSQFVSKGASILEVGCGVGIISKFLAKRASRVVATDISEKNVELARQYAASPKCEFAVIDIIEQAAEAGRLGTFDVILLADVIEHIPKSKYRQLFPTLEGLLTKKGRVMLTYPTPEHQEYLIAERPEARQLIDETIHIEDILRETKLKPIYFKYCDVFGVNDYVHMVLATDRVFSEHVSDQSPMAWLTYRVKKYTWRLRNLGFVNKIMRGERAGAGSWKSRGSGENDSDPPQS